MCVKTLSQARIIWLFKLHLEESTSCKESKDNASGFSIPDGFQIL